MIGMGGSTGGWHFADHDVFLRVWTQTQTCPVPPAIPSSSQSLLPDSSLDTKDNIDKNESTNTIEMMDIQYKPMIITSQENHRVHKKLCGLLTHIDSTEIIRHIQWYLQYLSLLKAKKDLITLWHHENKKDNNFENADVSDAIIHFDKLVTIKEDKPKDVEERQKIKKKLEEWKKLREDSLKEKQVRCKEKLLLY